MAHMALFRKNTKWAPNIGSIPAEDEFYFRITGTNLYFAESVDDMRILGAISVQNIEGTNPSELDRNCFNV